ncbi:hypothetical protein ACP70R_001609 [Stipagrostis hirtigluma subsp. patula]
MEGFCFACFLTLGLLLFFNHCLWKWRNRQERLPPGPRLALPFLGHFPFLKLPLHTSLAALAARHGPVLRLRLGRQDVVVVSSAEVAKECFSGDLDAALANRPHPPSLRDVSFNYSWLSRANYGAHWRTMRRVATVHLLSAHRVNLMSDEVIAREVRAMVRRLARAAAATGGGAARVELKRRLFDLNHSILVEAFAQTRSTYSGDADEDMSKEAQEIKDIMQEILPLVSANIWNYARLPRWLAVHGVRRKPTDAASRLNAFIYKMIDTERQKQMQQLERNKGEACADSSSLKKSMIGVMLSLQEAEPDVYTDTVIAALVANLLGAGTETTSSTAEWAMALLLNHPDILEKAQKEIDGHVGGGRLLDRNDLPHLPYLQCIINETLRLYPTAPMLVPHESSTDCKIHGYDVQAGTMLLVNAYAIQRDAMTWEEPNEFRPERFEHGRAERKFMIPFGMGRRKCPGENLAMRTLGLVLGALLQCFDWSRVEDGGIDMTQGSGTIMSKALPLQALCKPRANMAVFLQQV